MKNIKKNVIIRKIIKEEIQKLLKEEDNNKIVNELKKFSNQLNALLDKEIELIKKDYQVTPSGKVNAIKNARNRFNNVLVSIGELISYYEK